jgi:chromate transport protein ChrA
MKLSFKFLNRWENSIFESSQQKDVAPVSSFMAKIILVAAFVTIITAFVMLVFYNSDEPTVATTVAIIFGVSLLIVAGKAWRNLFALSSAWMKVGYAAYILAMFAVCAALFTYLSILFLGLFIIWTILKAMLGGNRKSGDTVKVQTTTFFEDGTSKSHEEEAKESGRGILGERYYRGKDSGNEYMKM